MAGHAGIFRRINEGRKIAKKTNQREYEIYANPGGIQDIIPAVGRTSLDNQEVSDMGENVIIMQNLFYGIQDKSLLAFDIKIGKSTTSAAQLLESGEENLISAFFREMKMKLYDSYTKSSTRGWRFIPIDDKDRATMGRDSETFLREHLDEIKVRKSAALSSITTQLYQIKDKLEKNQKTFIASSVLIVIDLQHPEVTRVKLIDLAHPINSNSKLFQKYKKSFDEGMTALIDFFRAYTADQEQEFK